VTLKVAAGLALPLDAATETFAILGKRGSGKSNTAVVLFEEMHRAGIPCVAIDPKGDWWGLRSASDGKGPGLAVPVFGGRHGDIPLEPTAGAFLADLIVERRLSAVVDVSELTRADVVRFLTAFAQRLYRQASDEPTHLFLEECHEYLPQSQGDPSLLAAWQRLVKQGRFKGLGCTLISQRSAAVNKDVLNQAEILVAMRVLAPHDRKAIQGWVEVHGDAKEVLGSLHELDAGEGWVWAPDLLGAPQRVRFRRRATFDSGATPKVGERRREPARLADVDLVAIKEQMADTIEKAKADDPKELRRRIAQLDKELRAAKAERPQPEVVVERVEVPVFSDELVARLEAVADPVFALSAAMRDALAAAGDLQEGRFTLHDRQDVPRAGQAGGGARPVAARTAKRAAQRPDPTRGRQPGGASVPGAAPALTEDPGEIRDGSAAHKMLVALAQFGPRTTKQLASHAGLKQKSSTVRGALAQLRKLGLVSPGGVSPIEITPVGLDAIGGADPLPTGDELLDHWRGRLNGTALSCFEVLVERYPAEVPGPELAELVGISPSSSTLRGAMALLRRYGLADGWRASEDLMAAVCS
jgi:hypothetical protein